MKFSFLNLLLGARFYTHLDSMYLRGDQVETAVARDIESGRLFRLMTKICTVVDRAELGGDYSWSEYGDRYMLKLFRDYVFHQVSKYLNIFCIFYRYYTIFCSFVDNAIILSHSFSFFKLLLQDLN